MTWAKRREEGEGRGEERGETRSSLITLFLRDCGQQGHLLLVLIASLFIFLHLLSCLCSLLSSLFDSPPLQQLRHKHTYGLR